MKKILLFITAALFSFANAQNLVENPSFEQTINGCAGFPIAAEGMGDLINWDNISNNNPADTCSTPDLFSTCNNGIVVPGFPPPVGVPTNALGYQCPRNGEKYGGIITYDPLGSYREYLQGMLTSPLQAGQNYCVSFYISLADSTAFATNNIGVHFANTHQVWAAPCYAPFSPVGLTPQLNYTCVLINTEWVKLEWNYVATGGEQYIIIGNFFDNGATTTANTGPLLPNPYAYYYIEDVSVEAGTCCDVEILVAGNTDCDNWSNGSIGANSMTVCPDDGAFNLTTGNILNGQTCSAPAAGTWSGTGITNTITGTFDPVVAGNGVHTITYTEACGFSTIDIEVVPCLEVCEEANGDFTVSGGVGPYTWQETVPPMTTPITNQTECENCGYTWAGFACLDGFMPVTDCSSPGGYTTFTTGTTVTPTLNYPLQVTDNSGNTFIISVPGDVLPCSGAPCPTLTTNITAQTNVNCFGESTGSATVAAGNGTAPYTYTWTPGGLNGATQTGLAAGTYTIDIVDDAGCPGTMDVTITQPASALTGSVNTIDASCGASDGEATAVPVGGTGGYSYDWSNTSATTVNVTDLPAGNATVTITDANGCQIIENFTINSTGAATLVISNVSGVDCAGATNGSATVTPSGGTAPFDYLWTPSGETTASATGLPAGNNTITVTDAAGCVSSEIVNITSPAQIVLDETITSTVCGSAVGEISVNASGGTGSLTYTWTPNLGTTGTISNLAGGMYELTVEDDNGCTAIETYEVDVIGSLNVEASPSTIQIEAGDTVQLFATGATNYTWTPATGLSCTNCPDPVASPTTTTTYTVVGSDDFGCTGQATVTIIIQTTCGDIYIPTIFSPNGDNNNDLQCVYGGCIATMNYAIYNRWGEKMFETDAQSECWDGTHRGKPVNTGTYFYKFNAILMDGTVIEESGNVSLVR